MAHEFSVSVATFAHCLGHYLEFRSNSNLNIKLHNWWIYENPITQKYNYVTNFIDYSLEIQNFDYTFNFMGRVWLPMTQSLYKLASDKPFWQ